MKKETPKFLDYFPGHVFRYIDQTGNGRPPVSSVEIRSDLNVAGYESYFSVNGFENKPDAKKENCTSLNAFFIDIDGRKDPAELEAIKKKLNPTFILETKNGYHVYWVLDEAVYREEIGEEDWVLIVGKWEKIEQAIVTELKADPVVKDLTRIMRIPGTFYWKKSGDAYKKGTEGVFKIKGLYKSPANVYSMEQVEEAFPFKEEKTTPASLKNDNTKNYAESERKDFFKKVNSLYPLEERESFQKLISGEASSLPRPDCRNSSLLVTASLMKQAGWSKEKAIAHFTKIGWHGFESERGGMQEILNTVSSAYRGGYPYSYKNEFISFNTSDEEHIRMQDVFASVLKERKEKDKIRFSTYEHEILSKHPNLKKNTGGIIFDYKDGVYSEITDLEISDMVIADLYEDMLWGYRTNKNVSDKKTCLLSIIPNIKETRDDYTLNLKNGLLNIYTLELRPHTPEYVSLVQLPLSYDPEALCPMWESCVSSWMDGSEKEEKTELLKQFAGYCLSSSMTHDKALFLIGDGGNGKSTFADTIAMVIGDRATSHIDLEGLYTQFGMHGLIGKRLNIIEEVHGNYYQSNKLKKLISAEPVTIDVKYKDQFQFIPEAKFIFAVNIMPRMDDTSNAMERRICAIVFKNNFRQFPNTALRSSRGLLAGELPGILNWMIEGAKSLKNTGKFTTTKEEAELLKEYRQENSSVEGFIAECLEFANYYDTPSREIYDEYKEYCQKDGRKFKSNMGFTKEMRAYGKKNGNFSYQERVYAGVGSKFIGIAVNSDWKKVSATSATKSFYKS